MRRSLWLTLFAVLLTAGFAAGHWAAAQEVQRRIDVAYRGIQIQVDGQTVATDTEPFVVVETGRTMVPARPLAEALGGIVVWNEQTNTVSVYTERYVETTPSGSLVRYRMPAQGLQVSVPARLQRTAIPGAVLAFAAAAEGATIQRLQIPHQPLEKIADAVLAGMRSTLGDLEVLEHGAVPWNGRDGYAVRAAVPGSGLELRLRVAQKGGDFWAVSIFGPRDAGTGVWGELEAIFAGFILQ